MDRQQLNDELEAAVNELVQAVEWVAHPHDHTPDTITVEAAADHLEEKLRHE